jgi:hypothetical protein
MTRPSWSRPRTAFPGGISRSTAANSRDGGSRQWIEWRVDGQHEVERILGCVVFPAAEIAAPGVIKLIEGNRFPVGELDGSESERVKNITATFTKAGFNHGLKDSAEISSMQPQPNPSRPDPSVGGHLPVPAHAPAQPT